MLIKFKDKEPKIGEGVFVADSSSVIGDVTVGDRSSIWFGAVIRGDDNSVKIGKGTNVQDLCVVHIDDKHDTVIGDDCVVGHRVIVHGAHIGDRCLIGMGSIIMNGVKIGNDSMIGAGALVTEGTVIPERSLVIGFPAKVKRGLTEEEVSSIVKAARGYAKRAESYL